MKEKEITKVMTSNYLFTLFFADGTKTEVYKTKFRGVRRPHVGDTFRQEGKKIFINGEEVKGIIL